MKRFCLMLLLTVSLTALGQENNRNNQGLDQGQIDALAITGTTTICMNQQVPAGYVVIAYTITAAFGCTPPIIAGDKNARIIDLAVSGMRACSPQPYNRLPPGFSWVSGSGIHDSQCEPAGGSYTSPTLINSKILFSSP